MGSARRRARPRELRARGRWCESGSELLHCSLKGRKLRIVCGDRVVWSAGARGRRSAIESIEPRRNLVERIDARGRAEPVAANVDRLAIVLAPGAAAGLVSGRPLLGGRAAQGARCAVDRQ